MISYIKRSLRALTILVVTVTLIGGGGWAGLHHVSFQSEASAQSPVKGGYYGRLEWVIKGRVFNCYTEKCGGDDCCQVF